ncbi:two-component sensor histidine kinase [Paenibacillus sp. FSL A5-0031]|uniref:sensor histidine kinase n=1 Tax=Paenibacillus sp. FSL A5-0031 TaxID=1920420 RepID=UPI0009700955|nr:HAMP domain-containing sensor histidine kinase [Paenibacillus sp. FSL A5-0031]OME85124.1 two-component sensor histidine kinase [Paenibacillus sp. FSL A5-0031]
MSIRLRLTLWYSGLLAVTLLVFGVSIYVFLNWNTYSDLKEQLKKQDQKLVVRGGTTFWDQYDLNLGRESQIEEKDMYIQIVNYIEGAISQSNNLNQFGIVLPYPEASDKPEQGVVEKRVEINKKKYNMLIHQRPIYTNDGTLVGLLQVGAIPYNEEKFLHSVRTTLIFASLIVVLIAFTIGLLIARQALRPIERVIRATEQIENGADLSVRIPVMGPKDEVGRLVSTLNVMLARLEMAYNELDEAYKAQRRFVSDASHELRTPLTTIRGNIELLERMWTRVRETNIDIDTGEWLPLDSDRWDMSKEAMSDISAEAIRMSTLVNDLLALARADAGYTMEKTPLDLLPLTEEVVRRAQLLPRTAEWKLGDLSALDGVRVNANHNYLQQLLFIFIENAFKYTSEGTVELSAVRTDLQIGFVIQDTGIGMNPDEIPHIFDRFYRADESRGVTVGTGLGLSIAKWIIDEHKGSVEVLTSEGNGTKFTIWLPISFSDTSHSSIIVATDEMKDS